MGGSASVPLQEELGRLLVTSSSIDEVCNYARGFLNRNLSPYEQRLIATQLKRLRESKCSVRRGAAEVARVLRYFQVKTVVAARDTPNFDSAAANEAENSALGRRGDKSSLSGGGGKPRPAPRLPRLRRMVTAAPTARRVVTASDVARARTQWRTA